MKTLLAVIACAGCTSNNDVSTGSTISNVPFTVAGTASMVRTSRGLTNLELTDFADVCSTADESIHANSKVLRFLMSSYTDPDTAVPLTQVGDFAITPITEALPNTGPYVDCVFIASDAACQMSTYAPCESGTVTLTRADATGYAGTFDVEIAGDDVTGSFDTTNCTGVSEQGFGTCH